MNAWVKVRCFIVLFFMGLALTACHKAAPNEIFQEEQIARDFYHDRTGSTIKYREIWRQHSGEGVDASLVSMAGELMISDPQNYTEYYDYVLRGVDSKDERVVMASVRALQNAHGLESIDILFKLSVGSNQAVAHTAVGVIKYRFVEAKNTAARSNEAQYIIDRISKLKAENEDEEH